MLTDKTIKVSGHNFTEKKNKNAYDYFNNKQNFKLALKYLFQNL